MHWERLERGCVFSLTSYDLLTLRVFCIDPHELTASSRALLSPEHIYCTRATAWRRLRAIASMFMVFRPEKTMSERVELSSVRYRYDREAKRKAYRKLFHHRRQYLLMNRFRLTHYTLWTIVTLVWSCKHYIFSIFFITTRKNLWHFVSK